MDLFGVPDSPSIILKNVFGNQSIDHCKRIPSNRLDYCAKMEQTVLRSICPLRCGCADMYGGHVGFFGDGDWGCPKRCRDLRTYELKENTKPCISEDLSHALIFLCNRSSTH